MKKILVIAAMMAMFVACKSVEDKAKDYVEKATAAMEAGDFEKAFAIGQEMEEWYTSLSDEDKAKVDAAMADSLGDWEDDEDYEY